MSKTITKSFSCKNKTFSCTNKTFSCINKTFSYSFPAPAAKFAVCSRTLFGREQNSFHRMDSVPAQCFLRRYQRQSNESPVIGTH